MKKKSIVISAVNIINGGTLTILRECLEVLSKYVVYNNVEVYALVNNRTLCEFPNIKYIEIPWSKKCWINRVYCEYFYMKRISKKIKPNVWLSLHDMTPNVTANVRAVYCHNAIPFYKPKINTIKYNITEYLFSKFYKYLYRINIHKNRYVIVQQHWLREAFCKLLSISKEKVVVATTYHSNKKIAINKIAKKHSNITTFFYPSLPRTFKNFEVIGEACKILNKKGIENFRVIITLNGTENKYAEYIVNHYSQLKQIDFCGLLNIQDVYEMYDKTDCLLFPSKLESLGLPIAEFLPQNKPMIVSDLPYAHETAAGGQYVSFFNPDSPESLAEQMQNVINGNLNLFKSCPSVNIEMPTVNSWQQLFDLLLK